MFRTSWAVRCKYDRFDGKVKDLDVEALVLVDGVPSSGFLFGLILVAAIIGGHVAHLFHVPRVVGFLLGGGFLRFLLSLVFDDGPSLSASEALAAAAAPLQPIKDLALGLILFTIGGSFERAKIRSVGPRVLRISTLEMGFTLILVLVACAVALWLTQPNVSLGQTAVFALLLATAALATAPAATLFVLQEYQAKGPVTDTILGLTAANNIVCIVAFQAVFLVLASLGIISTSGVIVGHLGVALGVAILGSVVLGGVAGTIISVLHAKVSLAETLLVFFALFILLGACEGWFQQRYGASYSFLLTALVAGAVFTNVALDSQKLDAALRTFGAPIFAGFFAMAGFDLHLEHLAHMGWLGVAYVLARSAGKWLGCRYGVRWAKEPQRVDGRLGSAMLCQAAVVIGLVSFVQRNWNSELAGQFATVILGSVVVFELIGPLLLKRCAVQSGEVKAITLIGRVEGRTEGTSIIRLTLRSFVRLFGFGGARPRGAPEDLRVASIMRTNVQLIRASETFDEVLHHIEHSTYSHFPVVHDNGDFAGMIHFSDVRDVIYDPSISALVTAVDLADSDSRTVPMDMPLSDLLDLFTDQNVAVLPVVERGDSNRITGIVEQRDLLRAMHTPWRES